jgi:hypothetical protein
VSPGSWGASPGTRPEESESQSMRPGAPGQGRLAPERTARNPVSTAKCPAYGLDLWWMSPWVHISHGTSPLVQRSQRNTLTGAKVPVERPRRCKGPSGTPSPVQRSQRNILTGAKIPAEHPHRCKGPSGTSPPVHTSPRNVLTGSMAPVEPYCLVEYTECNGI